MKLKSILLARCPACHEGKVWVGLFSIRPRCNVCDYNFHPEPGFYLGAIAISFLLTAIFTIPPTIALKFFEVDTEILVLFPFLEFLFLGTFLMFYCKIIWLHVEHAMTHRLDSKQENHLSRTQSTSPSKPTPQDQQNPKNQDPLS